MTQTQPVTLAPNCTFHSGSARTCFTMRTVADFLVLEKQADDLQRAVRDSAIRAFNSHRKGPVAPGCRNVGSCLSRGSCAAQRKVPKRCFLKVGYVILGPFSLVETMSGPQDVRCRLCALIQIYNFGHRSAHLSPNSGRQASSFQEQSSGDPERHGSAAQRQQSIHARQLQASYSRTLQRSLLFRGFAVTTSMLIAPLTSSPRSCSDASWPSHTGRGPDLQPVELLKASGLVGASLKKNGRCSGKEVGTSTCL